jgi:hypothetical protein
MKNDIISRYMWWFNQFEVEPKSVFKFCEDASFSESDFYLEFSDLRSVKESVLVHLWSISVESLNQEEFYQSAEPHEKMLSAMYAFVETLKANRSYLIQAYGSWQNPTDSFQGMRAWRGEFLSFSSGIGLTGMDLNIDVLKGKTDMINHNTLFANAAFVFHFWLKDRSKGFEQTDACIEKLFTLSFELLQSNTLGKAIDFGKFLFQNR